MKYTSLLIIAVFILFSCKKEDKGGNTAFAAFKADSTSIKTGDTVHFTDQTPDNPQSWHWRFPGGTPSSSNLQNPVVIYSLPGQYNVFLRVTNSKGTDSLEKLNYITVALKAPLTDFSANATQIFKGDSVHFSDESLYLPSGWSWKFQGGTPAVSALQNPTITYQDTGHFNVSLKVTNAMGSDSLVKSSYITVRIRPFVCGQSFTDAREGQIYPTVLINTQCWMKKNLNIGVMVDSLAGQTDNSIVEKYCYKNLAAYCDTFGGYYQWNEMMQYTSTVGAKGICPDGWHIPADAEWYIMENFIDPSISDPNTWGLRGTNGGRELKRGGSSGFDALLPGCRDYLGTFSTFGTYAFFWVSNSINTNNATIRGVSSSTNQIYRPQDRVPQGQRVQRKVP